MESAVEQRADPAAPREGRALGDLQRSPAGGRAARAGRRLVRGRLPQRRRPDATCSRSTPPTISTAPGGSGWARFLERGTPLTSLGFSALYAPLDRWLPWRLALHLALWRSCCCGRRCAGAGARAATRAAVLGVVLARWPSSGRSTWASCPSTARPRWRYRCWRSRCARGAGRPHARPARGAALRRCARARGRGAGRGLVLACVALGRADARRGARAARLSALALPAASGRP